MPVSYTNRKGAMYMLYRIRPEPNCVPLPGFLSGFRLHSVPMDGPWLVDVARQSRCGKYQIADSPLSAVLKMSLICLSTR